VGPVGGVALGYRGGARGCRVEQQSSPGLQGRARYAGEQGQGRVAHVGEQGQGQTAAHAGEQGDRDRRKSVRVLLNLIQTEY
jgi:hypothetical protein